MGDAMPTVIRVKGYRIGFFAADGDEPAHVHVKCGSKEAKYWLESFVRMAKNKGFRPHELNEIERILVRNRTLLLEVWNAYFRP